MEKIKIAGKTFISGPLAITDIHNGGTIFGIIYFQHLQFISKNEVKLTNKIKFNRGMKDLQEAKEKEIWFGTYSVDSDNTHLKCELTYLKANTTYFMDFIDEHTLLCEEYFMEDEGKSRVFSEV